MALVKPTIESGWPPDRRWGLPLTIGPKGRQAMSGWWFGTMEFYDFPYIENVIIPTDFHIFQRGRYTTNQIFKLK